MLTVSILRKVSPSPLQGIGFSKEVLSQKEELLRLTLSPDEKYRIYRPLKKIHPELVKAVLLLEDQYFYYHPGVNPLSMFRAFSSLRSDRKIGASTITMQMVRLKHKLFTRSLVGKVQQILFSFYYELRYSKEEILEAYLNLTPYGGNIEGVEAASRIYFGKSSAKLNLLESLTLAVIPQNPLKRSLNQIQLEQVDRARQKLTTKWLQTYPQDTLVVKESRLPVISNRTKDLPFYAPHFVEEVLKKYPNQHLIHTTLDLEIQNKIEERLKKYLESTASKGVHNGSVVLIDGNTREVKAWVGSKDFFDPGIQGQIDGIKVNRSPGSTLKPFVYGKAIDQGLIHPGTMLKDSPASFGTFDPENYDRRYLGPISATQALVQSRNVPAITLASKIDSTYLYDTLKKVGVEDLKSQKEYGLGIAIGTAAVTPFDLASMYTALYNKGEWQPLKLRQHENNKKSFQILSAESSFLVLDMLTQSPREQNAVLNDQLRRQFPMAWKTGTSYGFRDAWTAGVFGPYILIVWLGHFDYSDSQYLIGREMAAPLFFQIADLFPKKVLNDNFAWRNSFGLNLKKVEVCEVSGGIPNESCPHRRQEYFIPSVSPITACELHRRLMISAKSGMVLCGQPQGEFKTEVFEFWPSDILEIFQKFGVRRKSPPTFDPSCAKGQVVTAGLVPEILSPKKDLSYLISYSKNKISEKIPLRAMTDGDVKELNWFINREFVGKARADETLFYEAVPGHYDVIVVDDRGRTASREVEVKVAR